LTIDHGLLTIFLPALRGFVLHIWILIGV